MSTTTSASYKEVESALTSQMSPRPVRKRSVWLSILVAVVGIVTGFGIARLTDGNESKSSGSADVSQASPNPTSKNGLRALPQAEELKAENGSELSFTFGKPPTTAKAFADNPYYAESVIRAVQAMWDDYLHRAGLLLAQPSFTVLRDGQGLQTGCGATGGKPRIITATRTSAIDYCVQDKSTSFTVPLDSIAEAWQGDFAKQAMATKVKIEGELNPYQPWRVALALVSYTFGHIVQLRLQSEWHYPAPGLAASKAIGACFASMVMNQIYNLSSEAIRYAIPQGLARWSHTGGVPADYSAFNELFYAEGHPAFCLKYWPGL